MSLEHLGGKIDITTGQYITSQIINKIIAQHHKHLTTPPPAGFWMYRGVPFYDTSHWEKIPLHKELVASLERCRDYVNKNYLNVELTYSQVEDIFRFFCSDLNWRIFINNRAEYEILNKVIVDVVLPIEEITDCQGVYDKIIDEMENQCLFPRVRSRGK